MTQPFDAGHEQLVSAACSGLRSAFRGAAERSAQLAQSTRIKPVVADATTRPRGAGSVLWAAVVTFLLGLHFTPHSFHLPHMGESDADAPRRSAADASSD